MTIKQTPKTYHWLIMILIASIIVMVVVLGFVFYQVQHRPLPLFRAISPTGETLPLQPSESPNLLPDTVIRWASKAAVAAYTFDFVNFRKQLELARPYFTESGWNDYLNAIGSVLDTIVQNKLFVNGVISGTPVISNQGERSAGVYAWRIQMPFLVTYQTAEETRQNQLMMMLTIIKVPTRHNPAGIGIDEIIMR